MRLLLMTQLFAPEIGALPNRMYPFADALAASGHQVFIATGMPNYPRGIVFEEYAGKWAVTEKTNSYTVFRTRYYTVPRNKGKWSQLLSYISLVPALLWSGLRPGRLDVVFVTSPPLFVVIPAILLATMRRAKLITDLRDLWPDELVACGAARRRSLAVRVMRALERWAYRRSDRVCCTTEAFMETVRQRGVPAERLVFLPNGADLECFRPLARDNPLAAALGLRDKFAVMYSGILGIKHGLSSVLAAARLLEPERDIVFVFIGSGARERQLCESVAALGLRNVVFAGERPVNDIPHLLARADVCISTLLPDSYLEKIISVKIFEYFACGRPVVGAHSGETARIIRQSGAGLVVPPGDASAIAAAIRFLRDHPELRSEMGAQGRRYVEQHYSRRATAMQLDAVLRALMEPPGRIGPLPSTIAESGAIPSELQEASTTAGAPSNTSDAA